MSAEGEGEEDEGEDEEDQGEGKRRDENYSFISFRNYGLNKHGNRKIRSANMSLLQLKSLWS